MITIIYTILKIKLENFEPRKLIYCNFKQYDSDQFKLDIFNSMDVMRTHAVFESNFVSILDKNTPRKIKKFTRESKTPIEYEPSGANDNQITSPNQFK